MSETTPRITAPELTAMKSSGRKICMLTAYDYTMARLLDEAGVDGLLVGDSLAMVVQGRSTTLSVTMDQLIYHAEMVGRAARRALTVVDLPFPIPHQGPQESLRAASRILKETACQAVKLEGGAEQAEVISVLASAGIPVMAHVGLRPQSVHQLGGYKVQRDEEILLADALAAEQAGAFAVLLECIPAPIAEKITAALQTPTIGIGAGVGCDGQILVTHDILGIESGYTPKFVKQYAQLPQQISQAAQEYCQEVRDQVFPDKAHSFR